MEHDSSWLSLLIIIVACVLHGWFAAAISAVETLGSSLKSLSEQNEKLQYYAQQKNRLRRIATAEAMAFDMLVAVWCYFVTWHYGFLWIPRLPASCTQYLREIVYNANMEIFPGVAALLGVLLVNGIAKGIGRRNAERTAERSVRYVCLMSILSIPVQWIFFGIERLVGGKRHKPEAVTEEEIMQMVDEGNETGVIEESQREMINNIFEFDDTLISDVMTHRTELVAVEVEEKISDVVHVVMQEGYSRMPVYQGSIDNIIGILMVKDLLCLVGCENLEYYHIRHFMRDVIFVPETAKCKHVLQEMTLKKSQMAVVVDEYGGTAGVVSMEDILEEIVGNIQDEYDEEENELRKVSDSVFIIKGTADPDDILPQLGVTLPEGTEFDTMSGFVVELLGRIPDAEETPSVQYDTVMFTVLLIEDNWVSKIKAQIMPLKEERNEKDGEE